MWYVVLKTQHMKDEVEKQKDEVRNMTMILQNPDLLNHSVNGVNG